MKYRISYYKESELNRGRAPRYMEDVDASSLDEAKMLIESKGIVIRSGYKAPEAPIRDTPSFVFVDSKAREDWYINHRGGLPPRLCRDCGVNEVKRYKRVCSDCQLKRTIKPCTSCQKDIPSSSRKRFCPECSALRKEKQEKASREKRMKPITIERILSQIKWAKKKLKSKNLIDSCKLASRYQGLRKPHAVDLVRVSVEGFKYKKWVLNPNRCRACLQKFIDVQTVYLNNLMHEPEDVASTLLENENVLSRAVGA